MNKYLFGLFWGAALFFAEVSNAEDCKANYFLEGSKVFPDGGSIELKIKTKCGEKMLIEQRSSLRNRLGDTFVNGVGVIPGSEQEVQLLSGLDGLITKAKKGKDQKVFIELEREKLSNNSRKSYLPVVGLLQVICMNDVSKISSRNLCEKYKVE